MKRVGHKAENHQEADNFDIVQNQRKTTSERIDDYIELRRRIYSEDTPDVREYERSERD